ncbi:MAG: hypothetical protein A2648_01075 [Candidatus Lloydbacteria bacterium RIFCSPHIGHO2_01_FULL_41_20]|uniref:PrgI family protein n=1 Tax=Candidatus Lloydbacteria bacterium RIFCSPHIGHO2_01_FULL_41_20 TaxID=1798657 RepID=A0A1G2CUG3_9BACT|nr:MAG: hypothetical protein A2648_01075 [Candidatus Lloydbacteria bacterium RIFCSPHIGHO2_01_FULL_41_20]
MQFRVPQFIEIEDKIFGPFTFKQFLYLVGGAGISFVLYRALPFFIAIIFILPIIGFSLALAFYKVNSKPFVFVVEAFIKYYFSQKLYLWKKEEKKRGPKQKGPDEAPLESSPVPRISDSKLKELSWSLDVLDLNKEDSSTTF